MSIEQRGLVDKIPETMQVLSRVFGEVSEGILQFQSASLERIRGFEAEPRKEHIRAEHFDSFAEPRPARSSYFDNRAG